ncbi:hypothetical protein SAMN05216474_3011 [Lishizhenia tianjinensis]|uniref:Uncharacterized protein n=1 Tax=Lishizhenia tianjinensis TaxID=477690 RepID=A0A1I7BQW9_9FLAO|nr:hypothetical protein [Lishizhenia tianjinensis]SFT89582.1 hypothetical protein SAMN05216474_3011 [Lishizhenia tianjinensis]
MKLLLAFLVFFLTACITLEPTYVYQEMEKIPDTRDKNVCGLLKDSVILYAAFVDVEKHHPYTAFDLASTQDSIKKAIDWIEDQAANYGVSLKIKLVNHDQFKRKSIKEKNAKVSFEHYDKAFYKSGVSKYKDYMNWSDGIAKYMGRANRAAVNKNLASYVRINDLQSFNAVLRDKYEYENIAHMYFMNAYYEDVKGNAWNTATDHSVEFAIIEGKSAAVIAHEFLHLFGAVDLYPTQEYSFFKFDEIEKKYQNSIMLESYKDVNKLEVDSINAYFLGWTNQLSEEDNELLFHKLKAPVY